MMFSDYPFTEHFGSFRSEKNQGSVGLPGLKRLARRRAFALPRNHGEPPFLAIPFRQSNGQFREEHKHLSLSELRRLWLNQAPPPLACLSIFFRVRGPSVLDNAS